MVWQHEWYQVFRFARPEHADRSIKEYGGERMHPSEKDKGKNWGLMAQRHPQTMIVRWVAAGLVLLLSCGTALPDDMTGQASIIDGDTLEIHGARIRLWGIDAPESSQLCRGEDSEQYRCGAQAANELDALIARRPVSCIPISLDQYGRTVATCSVWGAPISGNGSCGMGLRWIGLNIPGRSTPQINETQSKPAVGSGRVVTSSRGYIGCASAPMEARRRA